jgi:hypothetical protein
MFKFFAFSIFLSLLFHQNSWANVFEMATGNWGVEVSNPPEGIDIKELERYRGCAESPVVITADKDTMRFRAVHTGEDNFISEGPILDSGPNWLSVRYDGETRLMKDGEPQIWHMVFVEQDKFYWVVGHGITEDKREGIVPVARVKCQNLIG